MANDYGLKGIKGALDNRLDLLQLRLGLAMEKLMEDMAAQAIAEHPYTDQTGQNTASIKGALIEATEEVIRGQVSAGMSYSKFLETILEGKYAYLGPVIERNKPHILAIFKAIVART